MQIKSAKHHIISNLNDLCGYETITVPCNENNKQVVMSDGALWGMQRYMTKCTAEKTYLACS